MTVKSIVTKQSVVGPSAWVAIDAARTRTVQVVITGTATVDIEGSNNQSDPVTLQAGITASGGYTDDAAWHQLRVNVKSITSGTVSVIVGEKA